ncbi:MAG: hypothetical protein IRY97_04475 [Thermomicrobiaceae bacterium]|nr:hypothetical protein [Thermomicrobiaceae bacterium]
MVGLPIALLGQAVGQSAFRRLAAHAAAGEWLAMRATLLRSLGAAVALALPALAGLLALGRPAIRILFEHGKFDAAAGDLTYRVLAVDALALPAYVGTEVITRGPISLRDTRAPLVTNSLQLAPRAGLIALLLGALGGRAAVETVALGAVLLVRLRGRVAAVPSVVA